tara:strand:- start:240 stop:461 length:222 start_codon:yes stop_codon:yes gene_type:complete
MVIEDLATNIPETLFGSVSVLVYIIQALGILTIFYVIFLLIRAFFDRKRLKVIEKMSKDVEEIKKLLKNKKRK